MLVRLRCSQKAKSGAPAGRRARSATGALAILVQSRVTSRAGKRVIGWHSTSPRDPSPWRPHVSCFASLVGFVIDSKLRFQAGDRMGPGRGRRLRHRILVSKEAGLTHGLALVPCAQPAHWNEKLGGFRVRVLLAQCRAHGAYLDIGATA